MKTEHITGTDKGNIVLYTLSTCVWCKKTKELLSTLGIGYESVEVDGLDSADKEEALKEMSRWNPRCSFPSMVVNGDTCIVGFDEKKIKAALGT